MGNFLIYILTDTISPAYLLFTQRYVWMVPAWNINSTSDRDGFTLIEPWKPGEDLDNLNSEDIDDVKRFYRCNPMKLADRKFMVDTAKKYDWLRDPDADIDCGTNDNNHKEYWTFARAFSENFKFVITFMEGNHRLLVILYTIMGLAALPHVPLMHESRKENRITKRYLDLSDKEFSHYNVKATDEDKDFTKKIEKLMSSALDTNMLTRCLHLNIYVPTVEATPKYTAAHRTPILKEISIEISNKRNNSSEQTNLDKLSALWKEVTNWDNDDERDDLLFYMEEELLSDTAFRVEFDPQQFPLEFPMLKKFWEDPNQYRHELTTKIAVHPETNLPSKPEPRYTGRPRSTMLLTTSPLPNFTKSYQPMWDLLLFYELIWTNQAYFGDYGVELEPVKVLTKAYYMSRWIRTNIMAPWSNAEWEEMPTGWKNYVEEIGEEHEYIGDPNTGGSKPGCGSKTAQINAISVLQFHMIQACEIGNEPQLLANVIDRMKADFGSGSVKYDQLSYKSKFGLITY